MICFSCIFSEPRKNTFELVGTVLNNVIYHRYRPGYVGHASSGHARRHAHEGRGYEAEYKILSHKAMWVT